MLDLDAYLARIGLHGRPSVAEVHRAHVTSIPFENLDPYCGIPVSLAVEDLERKLVSKRRGGYCFEQNLLSSTHPRSPFVTGLIVSAHADDGGRAMLRDWDGLALKEQTPAGAIVTPVEQNAVPELLATRFRLPGYAVSADGHLVPPEIIGIRDTALAASRGRNLRSLRR